MVIIIIIIIIILLFKKTPISILYADVRAQHKDVKKQGLQDVI